MEDRRVAICEAVLDLAAEGGNRAVSHGAVDRRLELPKGSTSYYFRTRSELLKAAIGHLAARSRAYLDAEPDGTVDLDAAAGLMAGQLDLLLGPRRRDALARYALAPDAAAEGLSEPLATCLFSTPLATELLRVLGIVEPEQAAADLISLLEGLLFDRLYGTRSLAAADSGTEASHVDLRRPIRLALGSRDRC